MAEGAGVSVVERDARFPIKGPGSIEVRVFPGPEGLADSAAGREASGVTIVVLPLDADAAARKLRDVPGWHVAIATRDANLAPRYVPLGETSVVLSTGRHGQYLVDVEVTITASRVTSVTPRFIPLDEKTRPSPIGQILLKAYQDRLRDERSVERMPRLPLPGNRYAGADACLPCHATQHASWKASHQAAAFRSLGKDGRVFDPDCVQCHVTGFPVATGYAGKGAPDPLAHVGCDSCHGPAGRHVDNPTVKPPADARAACVTCHTPEHSPHYDAAKYLERIRHW